MDKLIVRGTEVSIQWNMERDDYISLTDIAKVKDSDNPRYIIQNWMRNPNLIEFPGVWWSSTTPILTVSYSTRLEAKLAPTHFIYYSSPKVAW